jgi:hypothetical protein
MTAFRFTIEGEITAENAAEAFSALTEVLTRGEESLSSYETHVELDENIRVTLAPLSNSHD